MRFRCLHTAQKLTQPNTLAHSVIHSNARGSTPQGIELELASRPLKLRSERCWKLGLIVSELITNSARHAFGDRGGTIQVELSASGSLCAMLR